MNSSAANRIPAVNEHGVTSDVLQVAAAAPRVTTLGPGQRFALWLQGCPFSCPGCIAPGFQPPVGGTAVPVNAVLARIAAEPQLEGLTVSGGEPFAQSAPLASLLAEIRSSTELSVVVYSGYRLEELLAIASRVSGVAACLARIDVLIDGRYEHARNNSAGLRGSSNQEVHFLTARYRAEAELFELQARRIEIHDTLGGQMMVGVPSLDEWRRVSTARDPKRWYRDSAPTVGKNTRAARTKATRS